MAIGSSASDAGPRTALSRAAGRGSGRLFDWHVVRRMLVYLKPYQGHIALSTVAMLAATGLTLLAPYLVKQTLDTAIAQGDAARLFRLAVALIGTYLLLYVATMIQRNLLGRVSQRALADVREDVFRRLHQLSLGFYDTQIVGVVVSRAINDVATISDLLSQGLISLLGDLLILIGIIAVMLGLDARLALLTFLVLPLMVLATREFTRRAYFAYHVTRSTVAAVVGDLAEEIAGMRVIQAFAREADSHVRFETVNEANREAHIRAMSLSFVYLPTMDFLSVLSTGIVLWFGGQAMGAGELTLGVLVAFLAYVSRFYLPIQELSQLQATLQSAMAGGEHVVHLLDTEPMVTDKPDARVMPRIEGRVTFDRVSFGYRPDLPRVLHEVNLDISPGQTVALVGPTGAGKTSIASLILRYYDVTEGAVRIDGVDVRDVTQRSLRSQTGVVTQDSILFAGSVADNIRFGRPQATQAEVESAARTSNAHEFIVGMPQGYETPILEGAANISLGQRQLICIARAVLADPRILILDEATAHVDTVTEMLIQDALERLFEGRTTIVIAHRLSTIQNADLICVVDGGRIVEFGDHASLLRQQGLYYTLHQQQFLERAGQAD